MSSLIFPFFVFAQKYAVSGAQPVEAFQQVFEKVASESPIVFMGNPYAEECGPDGCEVPSKK